MNNKKITGIYTSIRAYEQKPILVVKRKIDYSQDQYNVYHPRYKRDIVNLLIEILYKEFDGFLEKFCEVDKIHYDRSPHRLRRYISKNKNDLYQRNDTFIKKHSFNYEGYYIGINIGTKEIKKYVIEMCESCNIKYGSYDEKFFKTRE